MVTSIPEITNDPAIDISLDTIKNKKQALVFCNTRRSAEATAEKIGKQIKEHTEELDELGNKILKVLSSPTRQCRRLAGCVRKGTAFHHAGLASEQRKLIENSFRKGLIKVICSTPTLCLSKDTMIWSGMKELNIQKFNSKDSLFVLSGNMIHNMKPQKIEKIFNEKDLIKITSVSGYSVILTPNHKLVVKRDSKKKLIIAKDCRKTDKVATVSRIKLEKFSLPKISNFILKHKLPFDDLVLTKDWFYMIGAMLGDGYSGAEKKSDSIIYKGNPCIVSEDKEVIESIKQLCDIWKIHYNISKNTYGTPQMILTKSNWFRELLCNFGIETGVNKHVNSKLMNADEELITSLLQGLYDTDGFVQSNSKSIGFGNTSIKLIRNIQKLLLRFRIVSYLREKKPSSMKIYNKRYNTKRFYELLISNKDCIKLFHEKINFKIKRKKDSLFKLICEINSNFNYVECKKCNYKLYKDLFFGRTKDQKIWGKKKLKIIETLGIFGELKSRDLKNKLNFVPRHKSGNRLNHHYELISKKKFGNKEWIWELNNIGLLIYKYIFKDNKNYSDFFNEFKKCPLCNNKYDIIIKKGWRFSDFDGDIYWDKIKCIKSINKDESNFVFDVVLSDNRINNHLFCANGIFVHNSMGINLPAFRTVIKNLKRYGGRWGLKYIQTLEYHQMAGRAGRPDFNDKYGEAICLAKNQDEADEIVEKFIKAEPEEIYSKLAVEPVLRTYCLSLVATGFCKSKKTLIEFFEKTFYGQQYGDMQELENIIEKILGYLEEWEFIKYNARNDFVSANDLGSDKIEATELGERVAQLYLDPYTAHFIITCLKRATQKSPNEFSFIQMACSTLELRPLNSVRVKEIEFIESELSELSEDLIIFEPSVFEPEYDDFLKSIKTTLALISWMNEKNEDDILEEFNIAPGELHVKRNLIDWILFATEEISNLLNFRDLIKVIRKTRYRLDKGVKEELIPLVRLKGIGRIRARVLFRNNIKDIGDLKKTTLTKLKQLIGPKTAKSLKKQLGQEVEEVKKGKRKGQLGLGKYST